MSDWIAQLLHYLLLAAGLGLCLYLFCSAKIEMRALHRKALARQESLERALTELRQSFEQGLARVPAARLQGRSGINWTERTLALRMQSRGESPATIAAALGVPANEIDLLLKVHRLSAGEAGAGEAG